jgi:hypothetical protein
MVLLDFVLGLPLTKKGRERIVQNRAAFIVVNVMLQCSVTCELAHVTFHIT